MDRQIIDIAIVFFAKYLPHLVFLGILGWFVLNLRRTIFWELAGAAILSRAVITETIRLLWHRARPFAELGLQPLVEHSADASFPSGHAAFFFALAAVIYAHDKKMGIAFFLLSAVISASRVMAGIHWPSDVLGGAVIGIGSAFLVKRLLNRRKV
mgnify:CR=1 FL=1